MANRIVNAGERCPPEVGAMSVIADATLRMLEMPQDGTYAMAKANATLRIPPRSGTSRLFALARYSHTAATSPRKQKRNTPLCVSIYYKFRNSHKLGDGLHQPTWATGFISRQPGRGRRSWRSNGLLMGKEDIGNTDCESAHCHCATHLQVDEDGPSFWIMGSEGETLVSSEPSHSLIRLCLMNAMCLPLPHTVVEE